MLKYTDITQNTYVQSWTVTEIKARKKCGRCDCTCKVLGNPKDNYDVSASVFVVQFIGFMSLTSYFDVKYRY